MLYRIRRHNGFISHAPSVNYCSFVNCIDEEYKIFLKMRLYTAIHICTKHRYYHNNTKNSYKIEPLE